MFLNINSLTVIIMTTITAYFSFLISAYYWYLFVKRFSKNSLIFDKKKVDEKNFYSIFLGIATSVSYIFILQFKYYLNFNYAPIINLFLLMHFSILLNNKALFFNWIGFIVFTYSFNSGTDQEFGVLILTSIIAVILFYLIKSNIKKWTKKYDYILFFNSLIFLILVICFYFVFKSYDKKSYVDWIANVLISFFSLIFLNFAESYSNKLINKTEKLKETNIYENGFFINSVAGKTKLDEIIKEDKINFGVLFGLDVQALKNKTNNAACEQNIYELARQYLKKFNPFAFITPNYVHAFFCPITKCTDNKEMFEKVAEIEKQFSDFIKTVYKFYDKSFIKIKIKAYSLNFGIDFWNTTELLKVLELGINNLDYSDNEKYKKFNAKVFKYDLTNASLKGQLQKFLTNTNYTIELELFKKVDNNFFYQASVYSFANLIFNISNMLKYLPVYLHEIFLREVANTSLKQFSNLNQKSLDKNNNFLLIVYPVSVFLKAAHQVKKFDNKLSFFNINKSQIIFLLYRSEKLNRSQIIKVNNLIKDNNLKSKWYKG